MRVFFQIAFVVMGFVQLFAAWDGFMYMLGVGSFVGGILAFFTAYIPVIGSVVGMYGAMNVWGWSFLQSFILFFWYLVLIGGVLAVQGLSSLRAS
jgi:hypothetical protein